MSKSLEQPISIIQRDVYRVINLTSTINLLITITEVDLISLLVPADTRHPGSKTYFQESV